MFLINKTLFKNTQNATAYVCKLILRMIIYVKKITALALLCSALTMLGCSAVQTSIQKQDLTLESHVSNAVVLEPLSPEERIVYVRVKDLSGNSMRKEMVSQIKASLAAEGVTVTNNPKEANLMLNAFIMSAKKTTKEEYNAALASGYKGGAEGALTAGAITSIAGGSGKSVAGVALAGAAIGFLADTLVEDSYYTFILDVELRERPLEGDVISNNKKTNTQGGYASQNNSALTTSNSSVQRGDNYDWIVYQTRIVSVANQMNLDINEAIPEVQKKTSETLSEFLL